MKPVFTIGAIVAVLAFLYFFIVTRFSLFLQGVMKKEDPTRHVYWIYKNRFLMRVTDRKPIVSAILLWNYDRLAREVVKKLGDIRNKKVLQLSCAFGNISENIARECKNQKADLTIIDIIPNELENTKRKLEKHDLAASYRTCDATSLPYPNASFDRVVSFFLFHELPLEKKRQALKESMRVLKPGGSIVIGEFHRPDSLLLRISGTIFFCIFERYAREMWNTFTIEKEIVAFTGDTELWRHSKKTFFWGNYAVFLTEKSS